MPGAAIGEAVDSVAHIIQVALTPVFLLSGIGALLNVFNTRLSRVSDHREHVEDLLRGDPDGTDQSWLRPHLARLYRRTLVLDASIVLTASVAHPLAAPRSSYSLEACGTQRSPRGCSCCSDWHSAAPRVH